MPHATNQYPFEWKIFEWATRLSKLLTGHSHYPFLILFAPNGQMHQIHFGDGPEEHDERLWQELRESAHAWLAYDPFEGPAYSNISWYQLPQGTVERLVGAPFTVEDLTAGAQTIKFPATWSVMF
jgi:hypothetical protein